MFFKIFIIIKSKIIKIILISILFLFSSNIFLFSQTVWKMTALAWGPYVDEKAEHMGSTTKKLSDMLKKEGISLVVDFYPWERAKLKAKTSEYVGYFPAWPEEVLDGFTASPPIDWSEIGIVMKKGDKPDFTDLDSLFRKYRIGIVSTYVYPDEINKYIKKYPENIDTAPDEVSLLKKLRSGRNKAAITDPSVMKYFAEQLRMKGFETAELIMKKELVIAMRDDDENRERIMLLEKILKGNIN